MRDAELGGEFAKSNSENLVNDGLDSTCPNNRPTWTYNQGVLIGGLTTLSKLSGDPKPLEAAQTIALSAIARLTDLDGVLHDPCEPARCGNDAPTFKGVFARNPAVLNAAAPVPGFRAFLRRNAESIWKNRDANGLFGVVWSGPSDLKTAATQVSTLDALVAAAEVEGGSARSSTRCWLVFVDQSGRSERGKAAFARQVVRQKRDGLSPAVCMTELRRILDNLAHVRGSPSILVGNLLAQDAPGRPWHRREAFRADRLFAIDTGSKMVGVKPCQRGLQLTQQL